MLPILFLQRMAALLGDEYPAFLASYDSERSQALRVNPLKIEPEQLLRKQLFTLSAVPWEKNGFYYAKGDQPGKHPYHEAGMYYIQEPSAMLPAVLLEAKPGERILDLCAAPGGKSTQLAAALQGQGLLLCNEIHPARAKILSENIERMGIRNALAMNESPQALAARFPAYFDRIMVDAPCSGEGMFRKNEEAAAQWSKENVMLCAARQLEILDSAAAMLRPGGRMVYSTCTFAPEENEGSISRFLERHPEFHLLRTPRWEGMESAVPEWTEHPAEHLAYAVRLFPHKLAGEGHFAAVLEKDGEISRPAAAGNPEKTLANGTYAEVLDFLRETLTVELPQRFTRFGDQVYLLPEDAPALKNLRVLRPGLHIGTIRKNRFEPAHALALALRPQEARHVWELEIEQARAYLNGQTFPADGEKGWYLITVDGCSLGWGKLAGGMMKNHYPKGLRK